MAKKHAKILRLDEKLCRFGKISNNLERHGDDYETGFTIPVEELMLSKAELNAFMRDPLCWQSWYDTSKGNRAAEPMPWWGGESFSLAESFEADEGSVIVSGDKALEFKSSGDPKGDDYRAGIVISKINLQPRTGGLTELSCSIYVRPGLGKTNLVLQDHQHREVKLTLIDAKVAEREKRQPQLPLGEASDKPESGDPSTSSAEPPPESATAH
jgi:hypothetical protein